MNHNQENIIRKIKALLRLSENNPSIEEAATAANKAQELIIKYNLLEAIQIEREDSAPSKEIIFDYSLRFLPEDEEYWQSGLAFAIAGIHGVNLSTFKNPQDVTIGVLCGQRKDVILTLEFYSFLRSEIIKLSADSSHPKDFVLGAAMMASQRLKKAFKVSRDKLVEQLRGTNSLAILDEPVDSTIVDMVNQKYGKTHKVNYDFKKTPEWVDGYVAGTHVPFCANTLERK